MHECLNQIIGGRVGSLLTSICHYVPNLRHTERIMKAVFLGKSGCVLRSVAFAVLRIENSTWSNRFPLDVIIFANPRITERKVDSVLAIQIICFSQDFA